MYRKEIDGLRAIAIIAVLINHTKHEFSPNGYLGVDLFFVLSGFVITKSLLEKRDDSFRSFIKNFWSRRIKRLLPALLFTVSFGIIFSFLFSSHESYHTTMSIETGLFSLIGMGNLYLATMATDYFSTTAELNAFTHTWSLGVEEQFYLFFPILFWFLYQRKQNKLYFILTLFLLTIASYILYNFNFEKQPIKTFYFVQYRFWELSLGSLSLLFSEFLSKRQSTFSKKIETISVFILPALLFSLFYFLFNPNVPKGMNVNDPLIVCIITAFLLFLPNEKNITKSFLTFGPVQKIGLISYSLYLWHWPILTFFSWIIGIKPIFIPYILLICLLFAYISYRFIESPLRKKEWRWKHFNSKGKLSPAAIGFVIVISLLLFVRLGLYPFYLKGNFYLGEVAQLESKGVHNLLSPLSYKGETWDPNNCVLINNKDISKEISISNCSLGKSFQNKRKFLVIGNSYAVAEVFMFRTLAENNSMVTITASLGSAPAPNISSFNKWDNTSKHYWNQVVPNLLKTLNPKDVVLMVFDINGLSVEEGKLKEYTDELSHFIELRKKDGIYVVLQHAIPFMRESNCNPDLAKKQWWHKFNDPPCFYYSKQDTILKREPLTKKLEFLQKQHSNFYILDLIDTFCPNDSCTFTHPNGQFLFRDEFSHPSIEASILAGPKLLHVIKSLE
ncbi:acyltransferase family protein [Leptospira sp. WS39.C2]